MAFGRPVAYDSAMTADADPSPVFKSASAAIRAVRATSNQAIAARDADRVVACMMSDVTVAVAHGPRLNGREASRAAFAAQFAERSFMGYVREPHEVAIHDPPTQATEHGRWLGRWKQGMGEQVMRGTYVAEWAHTALGWFIQSEVYAPGDA